MNNNNTNGNNLLNNIKVVLCETSHSGNIGSTARAMKTMGITNLCLVNPQTEIDGQARALSSNAVDVLNSAIHLDTLDEAIADCSLVIGLTSRKREFNQHLQTPKQIVDEILELASFGQKIALVFGSEKNGLTTEQIEKCNRLVTIPGNPNYFSLNLSQAVQIICYEIYSTFDGKNKYSDYAQQNNTNTTQRLRDKLELANTAKRDLLLASIAHKLGFERTIKTMELNRSNVDLNKIVKVQNKQELTLRRIKNIINKADLTTQEVDLALGLLKSAKT